MKKRIFFAIISLIIPFTHSIECNNRPWIYFDLGNTVIDTRDPQNFDYFEGGEEYVNELLSSGYNLGVISNIPESWGETYGEKLLTLKSFIAGRWGGAQPFNWDAFSKIIIPMNNEERKPNPILFERAMVHSENCPIVYMSENLAEVEAATALGIAGYLTPLPEDKVYLDTDDIKDFMIENYKGNWSSECFN